jgi:hypothetical protein
MSESTNCYTIGKKGDINIYAEREPSQLEMAPDLYNIGREHVPHRRQRHPAGNGSGGNRMELVEILLDCHLGRQ